MDDTKCVILHVSPELAKKYEDLRTKIPHDSIITEYMEDTKKELHIDLDNLDYEMLQYKASLSKWHKAMEAAYEEVSDKSEKLFLEFDKKRPSFSKKLKEIEDSTKPLSEFLDNIIKKMKVMDDFRIERLMELIRLFSTLHPEDKKTLQKLFSMERNNEK